MKEKPELLYLDLMKKTLSFTLWPEPPILVETLICGKSRIVQFIFSIVSSFLKIFRLHLVWERDCSMADRTVGKIWPAYAHTMIGLKRLDNLQFCIETIIKDDVPGDLIETGVWRGGACIFMRAVLAVYGVDDRRIYVADSFEGLPKPDVDKFPADKGEKLSNHSFLKVSQDEVENNFEKYGLLDEKVVFLKGWFKDTLPTAPIERLAVLRLDGDMYSSTIDALNNLYPKLSVGGFCIIDDYAGPGCKAAVNDFRSKHMIDSEIKEIDHTGIYWRKA